jgi:transcriptional regulator with XRE-family HTH domain
MSSVKLAQLRRERGWSQAELARQSGVTQQAICLLEQGKRRPMLDTCEKLARALNVTIPELLTSPLNEAVTSLVAEHAEPALPLAG